MDTFSRDQVKAVLLDLVTASLEPVDVMGEAICRTCGREEIEGCYGLTGCKRADFTKEQLVDWYLDNVASLPL